MVIKKTSLMGFQFLTLLLVLCVMFMPISTSAGTFYNCIDKAGNENLVDFPIEGQSCAQLGTFEEKKEPEKENKSEISRDERVTKIIVRGNQILVPVTLIHGRDEVNIHLLMDTGASGTTIHTEIADQLYLNLLGARKAQAEVVGGSIIEAKIFKMDSLKLGPHTFTNQDIFIVPYEGKVASFDGLLGMDLLGRISYRIDLAKQLIYWE